RRRGGVRARLQLPHCDDHGAADARARVWKDERALAGAGRPRRTHGRGVRDGPRPARRHHVHRRPDRARDPRRGAAPAGDQGRRGADPESDRAAARPALGGVAMSTHDLSYSEPEKIKSIDAEFLAGHRFPYQEDMSLVEDIDLMAAT